MEEDKHGLEDGEIRENQTIPIPSLAELKEIWPNFKVKDPRFNWLPGEVKLKAYDLDKRGKEMPKYSNKVACKFKGECSNQEKVKLAMIASLDIRGGRKRHIVKSCSPHIKISDFAVITCCQKMANHLKLLKK